MEQQAREWKCKKHGIDVHLNRDSDFAFSVDEVASFARSLAPLPLSMTEEEIERIGWEERPKEKVEGDEIFMSMLRDEFKAGLRYESTHTKTITVDQIMEVAAEWLNEMEGMHSYMNTYLLRDRLTAKFK